VTGLAQDDITRMRDQLFFDGHERNRRYELAGCVEDFPSGTDVLWYRKRLNGSGGPTRSSAADGS
jgi:hypothetical protein